MAIKTHRPTSAGRRFYTTSSYEEVTKKTPEKSLLAKKDKHAGRNSQGKVTVRHQGGGNRQKYRIIDFKRNKDNVPAKVVGIEYDPNRTAYIALLSYADGEKRYIIAPVGLKDGDTVMSGENVEIKVGNNLPLASIPLGSLIHNIELEPKKGGQLARSAGAEVQLMAKEGKVCNSSSSKWRNEKGSSHLQSNNRNSRQCRSRTCFSWQSRKKKTYGRKTYRSWCGYEP